MTDTTTSLDDFLKANAAWSTISIPGLKTPIQAQRMLEFHATIVQQLVGPELLPQYRPDGNTSSMKMKTNSSLHPKPQRPHVWLASKSGELSFVPAESIS